MARKHGASWRVFADPHLRDRIRLAKPKPSQWYLATSSQMRQKWWHVVLRDRSACRYCGATHSLTFDHVKPRAQGGRSEYGNLVLACRDCNQRKGPRTPEQAGMPLRALE